MKKNLIVRCRNLLVWPLAFALVMSPLAGIPAFAQEAATTSAQMGLLQRLAQKGLLGAMKGTVLASEALEAPAVADALAEVDKALPALEGKGGVAVADLQGVLDLIQIHRNALWERKVQVWSFEKRVKDLMETTGRAVAPPGAEPAPKAEASGSPPATAPAWTPPQGEWEGLKTDLKGMSKRMDDMQGNYDRKLDRMEKDNAGTRATADETQEQFKLVKKLLDQVQENLKKTETKLDDVAQKALKKTLTDDELRQELTIMHKDLRDHAQDLSVLKQEVAKLDKSGEEKGRTPLDSAFQSPFLAGGALVVGIVALVIALTNGK